MKWEPGRQGTGYRKLRLVNGQHWDLHVIDYPAGVGIPRHFDLVPNRRHLRVNVALRTGGARLLADAVLFRIRERLVVFWSDRKHEVTPARSRRTVVSLGLALEPSR